MWWNVRVSVLEATAWSLEVASCIPNLTVYDPYTVNLLYAIGASSHSLITWGDQLYPE